MARTRSLCTLLLVASSSILVSCSTDPDPRPDMAQSEDQGQQEDMAALIDMTPDLAVQDMPEDLGPDLFDASDMPPDAAPDLTTEEMGLDMEDVSEDMPLEDMQTDMPPSMMPLPGFGVLSGDCQQIDDELSDPNPSSFRNTLDFAMDPYDTSDLMWLTQGGQDILAAGNAGGSSLISEVFAFEVLARCESATLLETEKDIDYTNPMGKITDLLVEIDGERVGVSVVRAFLFPFDEPYPEAEARRILEKKLEGINLSTQNVQPHHAWVKQILSVMAYSPQHADQIETVYQTLDADLKSDTILYITVTDGEDGPVYFNE